MRQTAEQIDNRILNAAAGLFALHGFERTSVQQIADTVGYSKTGLLHRFPSKEALRDAVHARIDADGGALIAELQQLMTRPDGERQALQQVIQTVLAWPGPVSYLIGLFRAHPPGEPKDDLPGHVVADGLVNALAGVGAGVERRVRALLVIEMICAATAVELVPEYRLGDRQESVLLDIATAVLGSSPRDEEPAEQARSNPARSNPARGNPALGEPAPTSGGTASHTHEDF